MFTPIQHFSQEIKKSHQLKDTYTNLKKHMHMCTEGTHQSQANKKAMTLTERSSNPPPLKNSLDKWREHRPWVLFWSICSGSQMYLRLCSLPKRSCGAGDRVGCDRTHLTDPWDTWMPCGDVLNALIGQRRSVSLSGGWNLGRASVCFQFIHWKICLFESLQRFPF